jgi:hypothetical protein
MHNAYNVPAPSTRHQEIMGESSPMRRLVDEYCRDPVTGRYRLARWVGSYYS